MPDRTEDKHFGEELLVAVLETVHKDYSRNVGHDPVSFCEKAEPCLVEWSTYGVSENWKLVELKKRPVFMGSVTPKSKFYSVWKSK